MSVVFSGSSGFLHQYNWSPRYNWNIVESGVKHHKDKPNQHNREKLYKVKFTAGPFFCIKSDHYFDFRQIIYDTLTYIKNSNLS